MTAALDPQEAAVLRFASRWWRTTGARDEAIHTERDMSPARYWQVLNRLLDDERAWVADPLTVQRWTRIRQAGLDARAGRGSSITATMGGSV